jgi:hypothetical protein
VSLRVLLRSVALSGAQVPSFGLAFSTVKRETLETLENVPLANWVYVIPVVPALRIVATRPFIVAIVGSVAVADQAPGEFEVGGTSVAVP